MRIFRNQKTTYCGSAWQDARMLSGNRFESDLDLATGANAIDIRATDGSNNVANYTYSLTLAAASAAAPVYDADGNMTSDGVRSYEWDRMSRLVKVTWGGSPAKSTEYRYNALGQRSERIEKSGTSETAHHYYLYEGIRLLCRYQGGTAATNIDRRYFAQGEQRKISSAWSSYYYNRDHLGSVREVMNADGSLAARYDYTPCGVRRVQYEATAYTGEDVPAHTNGCDLGFTGHITQASGVPGQTGLVLTHFRGYDPELGRWVSADPVGEAGGLNLYGYVGGDPINMFDPMGLASWRDHWQALTTWTGDEFLESYGQGASALWDGIIPGADPFSDNYDRCADGIEFSKAMGNVAREAALLAAGGKIYKEIGKSVIKSSGQSLTMGGRFAGFIHGQVGRAAVKSLIGRQAAIEAFGPRLGSAASTLLNAAHATLPGALGLGATEAAFGAVHETFKLMEAGRNCD